MADREEVSGSVLAGPAPAAGMMAGGGNPLRILIADDSEISRRVLESMLRKWGYEVVSAGNGVEAWEILQGEKAPRLAILDWMMPGLSGPEVCRLVREQAREYYTYILLLTSRNLKEDLITGMEAGADDYVVKPFDQHELKVRLGPGRRIIELQSELLKTQALLVEQATHDALTNVWNRRSILEILEREIVRCSRERTPLGMIMADLDGFKAINDTFGHPAGDAVLKEAAFRLVSSVRPYDAVGRYGGEEFMLILPGCDAAAAEKKAEWLRISMEEKPVFFGAHSIPMTASFGVTSQAPETPATPDSLIRVADNALYMAKHSGRNACCYLDYTE